VFLPLQQRWPEAAMGRREVGNGGGGACSAWLEVEEASWVGWAKKAEWASVAAWVRKRITPHSVSWASDEDQNVRKAKPELPVSPC
jgi:hypothetical protein